MLVPIWAATWELECCQLEAEAGKEWKVPVAFRPGRDPWWVTSYGATATQEQRQLGIARLDATAVEVDEDFGQQLMTAGPISFRAETGVRPGPIEGRLSLDAHVDPNPFRGRDLVRGVAERVQIVPLRFVKKTDRVMVPAEQLDAVEARSTTQRGDVLRWRDEGLVDVDLLVWLKVGD
ncbi:MAG TPA: hypothetical protein VEU29_05795 [Actinomycetota bacterium]|nr:hypothetical protein [Actinomycetota bacterium]